jgi:hypothetical protein
MCTGTGTDRLERGAAFMCTCPPPQRQQPLPNEPMWRAVRQKQARHRICSSHARPSSCARSFPRSRVWRFLWYVGQRLTAEQCARRSTSVANTMNFCCRHSSSSHTANITPTNHNGKRRAYALEMFGRMMQPCGKRKVVVQGMCALYGKIKWRVMYDTLTVVVVSEMRFQISILAHEQQSGTNACLRFQGKAIHKERIWFPRDIQSPQRHMTSILYVYAAELMFAMIARHISGCGVPYVGVKLV